MVQRKPSFIILSSLLAVFCVAGICIRYLTRFLPENQPNRLAKEYGSYVKQASRQHIDWFPFGATPFAKARAEDKLIFMELGSSFSRASNVMTKHHFNDPELARLLNNHFVSVRADLSEMPWLADQIDLNRLELFRASGSLVLVLTPEGQIIQTTPFLPLYSSGRSFGLLDWVSGVARDWVRGPESVRAVARSGQIARQKDAGAILESGELQNGDVASFENSLADALREANGSFAKQLTPVSAVIPAALLESASEETREIGCQYLMRLRESASYDQLRAGVFFSPSLPNFEFPNVGKEFGMNALLAVEFARAGLSGKPLFTKTAEQMIAWLMQTKGRDPGVLPFAGLESDEHPVSGTRYYAFPKGAPVRGRLLEMVEEPLPIGASMVRLRKTEELAEASSIERYNRIERDAVHLLADADFREPPPIDSGVYADKNGQIISALYQLSGFLDDKRWLNLAETAYLVAIRTFVQPLGDCLHAPGGAARMTGYSGDYLWLARAGIEKYAATGSEQALSDALRIMGRCAELFDDGDGIYVGVLNSAVNFVPFALKTYPCTDNSVESNNALAARNWIDLGQITGDTEATKRGTQIIKSVRGRLPSLSWSAGGFVRAEARLMRPYVVAKGVPIENITALKSRIPTVSVWPAPAALSSPRLIASGFYLVTDGKATGPHTSDQIIRAFAG